jgi:MYXO-CTERM domain-containing protein
MRRLASGVVLAAFVICGMTAAKRVGAAELVIDDFSEALYPGTLFCVPTVSKPDCPANTFNLGVFTANSSTTATDQNLAGVVGGSRKLTVAATTCSFCGSGQFDDKVVAGADPGLFCYNSTVGADGSFELQYDAAGAGLSTSVAFAQGIRVELVNIDASSFPLTVTLTLTSGANVAQAQQVINPGSPLPTALTLDFPFPSFTNIGAVDLFDIFSLSVGIDPNLAADLQVSNIQTYGTPTEESGPDCGNGLDDDNNGFIDCRDINCARTSDLCNAPAPALSPPMLAVGLAVLIGLGGIAILRRRRSAF